MPRQRHRKSQHIVVGISNAGAILKFVIPTGLRIFANNTSYRSIVFDCPVPLTRHDSQNRTITRVLAKSARTPRTE
jgi:hypothetical protein